MKFSWEISRPIRHGFETCIQLDAEGSHVTWSWLNQDMYSDWKPHYQNPIYDSIGKIYLRAPKNGDISVNLVIEAHDWYHTYESFTIDIPHVDCRSCTFRGWLRATRVVL
jgi:hypothetical protein